MLALLELALSRPEFRERIPNAHLVVGPGGEPWEGVGHARPSGGGARNAFGEDFAMANFTWTEELAAPRL